MLLYLALFLTCVSNAFSLTYKDGILSLRIQKMDSMAIAMYKNGMHPKFIEKMIESYKPRDGNGTIPVQLYKLFDNEFYGKVRIGKKNESEPFLLSFDTAWGDTWVPSVNCTTELTCRYRNKYSGRVGINTKTPFNIPMENSSFSGMVWADNILINNQWVPNQKFGVVNQLPHPFLFSKSDGVIGLSMRTILKTNSFMNNLQSLGLVERKIFSFYINRSPNTAKGGTIFFGGVQKKHYKGEFTEVDTLPPYDGWNIHMEKLTIGPKFTVCKNGCNVTIDTGSSLIGGPEAEIDSINQYIGAKKFYFGRYTVSCVGVNRLPDVTFSIGGTDFVLQGVHYVQQVDMDPIKVCLTTFKSWDANTWSIGGSFMSAFYTSFDVDKATISFATSL